MAGLLWDQVKQLWYQVHDGERRYMGRKSITPDERKKFGIKRANINIIPTAQWTEQDFRSYAPAIKNQGTEGACVAYSGTTVHQTSRAMQGMTFAGLSTGCLYGQINGGSDNGASVEDALTVLESTGQCLTATIPDQTWQQRRWPSGWQTEAARFKIEIGGEVTTFEEICSLLEIGQLTAIGIDCGNNFNTDGNGILANQSGGGGGHGLPVLGKTKKFGDWRLIIRNSWGTSWGIGGDCFMPRDYIDNAQGGHYHVTASRDDPQDPLNPPIAA